MSNLILILFMILASIGLGFVTTKFVDAINIFLINRKDKR